MQQKRSRTIDLSRMLKQTLFPASALAAAFMLGGCGANEEEGYYFTSVEACEAAYPDKPDICTAAYQDAEQAAVESGPRYDTAKLCESEFGMLQCQGQANDSFWMPLMAGFIVSRAIDRSTNYQEYRERQREGTYSATPFYNSISPGRSGLYGLNGQPLRFHGTSNRVTLERSAYQHQSAPIQTSQTIKRGGFGSTVRGSSTSGFKGLGG